MNATRPSADCHDPAPRKGRFDVSSLPHFAIAGNPNSGKTTLFNRITGLRQKVGNYPGVTVERKEGTVTASGVAFQVVDLPGTYSLSPKSEEERVAAEVIAGARSDLPPLHGVVCVCDSTNLERSLFLALQLIAFKVPVILVLNMMDELASRGGSIDLAKLKRTLGVSVFPISARTGKGLPELLDHLAVWARTGKPHPKRELPVVEPTPRAMNRQAQATRIAENVTGAAARPDTLSDRLDRFVLHPVLGPLIFLAVVLIVFQSIFTGAKPLMEGLDALFNGLSNLVTANMAEGLLRSFLTDGVIAGFGAVVVFLPQILILFLFIAVLEHSGYMARAAMIMDRLMSTVGLQGKSFLPLVSSLACAVPGIMATRTIENRRDRLATIFIAPFMTCSARLPVYALLIGAFVPDKVIVPGILGLKAVTLLFLYFIGFVAAMTTAFLLKSSILKSDRMPFVMEVPPYRPPAWRSIALTMWDRAWIFLKRAGTIILGVNLLLWFLVSFPRPEAAQDIKMSYAGRIGTAMEPALKPLGFDWKIGVGLLSAQAAREVIVSTLSTIYKVEAHDDDNKGLAKALQGAMTPLAALSLLVYFAFSLQCTSTIAIIRRETGRWRWPVFMFVYMLALGYVSALIVYQGGRALGFQ